MRTTELLDGRYQLGALIGTGGMADVYRAVDTRLDREVAIKLFRFGAPAERLAREANLLAGLSHPGLLKVYDVATDRERPYLVLQLVDGPTLRHRIDRGGLGAGEAALLGARLADTLAHVHRRGVVHRDIKPSNVLLDPDGVGYLADFGIARAVGSSRITRTGHCVGTAAYLAPEQLRGEETGPPADVYSLGLVLLECLTGAPEYEGSEVEAAMARLSRSPRVPDWLPPAWVAILTAMTAREPGERPDAEECAWTLAAIGSADGLDAQATPRQRFRRGRVHVVPHQTRVQAPQAAAVLGAPAVQTPATQTPAAQTTVHLTRHRRPRMVHAGLAAAAMAAGGFAALLAGREASGGQPPVADPPAMTSAPAPVTAATAIIQATQAPQVITVTVPEPAGAVSPGAGGGTNQSGTQPQGGAGAHPKGGPVQPEPAKGKPATSGKQSGGPGNSTGSDEAEDSEKGSRDSD